MRQADSTKSLSQTFNNESNQVLTQPTSISSPNESLPSLAQNRAIAHDATVNLEHHRTVQQLLQMLDEEVCALENLVSCTQREQQHILAFEPEELGVVVEEKRQLLMLEDALRIRREALVANLLRQLGASATARTLSDLVAIEPPRATALRVRRDRLQALLGALSELNAVAAIHAKRQLRWSRSCRKALTGKRSDERAYGPGGAPGTSPSKGLRLRVSV